MKLSDTYKELGIDFTFPIKIVNSDGKLTYLEHSDGSCVTAYYDINGYPDTLIRSDGSWIIKKHDSDGKLLIHMNSEGVCEDFREPEAEPEKQELTDPTKESNITNVGELHGQIVTLGGVQYTLTTAQ